MEGLVAFICEGLSGSLFAQTSSKSLSPRKVAVLCTLLFYSGLVIDDLLHRTLSLHEQPVCLVFSVGFGLFSYAVLSGVNLWNQRK